MNGENFAEKLRALGGYAIVFTLHAELRLSQRQIERERAIEQLKNPVSLKLVEKLPAGENEEKYKLWFVPSKRTAFVYVVVLNHLQQRIIIKTAIKQRLFWQKRIEKNVKKI